MVADLDDHAKHEGGHLPEDDLPSSSCSVKVNTLQRRRIQTFAVAQIYEIDPVPSLGGRNKNDPS